MKMLLQNGLVQIEQSTDGSDHRTVVVGVKLDQQSRELLTWSLVKVAEPGDQVVALHVLDSNDIVNRDGQASLLSLVRAFDSVLAVYEGFCNLKQVDLKLKICRGKSVRKIIVREAKSYSATKIIVGTTRNRRHISSSTSLAKYCAKKLSKDCWVIAVNNGKIIFQREASLSTSSSILPQGTKHVYRPNSLINVFNRSISRNSKVLNDDASNVSTATEQTLEQALVKERDFLKPKKCLICDAEIPSNDDKEEEEEEEEEGSLAIVPIEAASSLVSLKDSPGWPLLRRSVLPESGRSPARDISVVQWVMRLPSRRFFDKKRNFEDQNRSSPELDGKSGALVLVGGDDVSPSPRCNESSVELPEELESLHEKYSSSCRLFKYEELVSATSNFPTENLIGKGGSSRVYKGCLPDKEIAVKILKQSEDVLKEFMLEIEIITALNHKNVISLLGFSFEDDHLLLVYDLLSRGSLEENLYGLKKHTTAFGLEQRYKVALGVAEALDYLHRGSNRPVIHRDVKSSNILLSDDFEPQLSDFGLAKWASTSSTYITCTDVVGTFGYLAPEYFMYGKVNEKIDVYAFGVVLLELLSGRKPICDDRPKGQESLVMWAKPILSGGKVSELLDPSLGDQYDPDQIERMVLAATLCIRRTPRARPQMGHVLKLLQGDQETTKWAKLQVSSSEESTDLLLDEEASVDPNIKSHLTLALCGVEDDSLSMSIAEQNVSLEDYLRDRWSRSSSFD